MKLYLIRHGESVTNAAACYTGWSDVPLTENGRESARQTAPLLAGVAFDKVYASDLQRARETARLALPSYTAEVTPLLRELHLGSLELRSFRECRAEYGEILDRCAFYDRTPFGGENYEMLSARAREFLRLAVESGHGTVAAFSHAGFIRTALTEALGAPYEQMIPCLPLDNCGISILEYTDGIWRLEECNRTPSCRPRTEKGVKTLYLIRHGESTANLNHRHAGWAQIPLTARGREQARATSALLDGIAFDKVYTSDLRRAMETRELVLPFAEAEATPLIREIGVGSLSGRPFADCEAEYGDSYRLAVRDHDFTPYGGENAEELRARVEQFLRTVRESDRETVAAFCHGGAIHTVASILTGLSYAEARRRLHCRNCGIFVFTLHEKGAHIRNWNYT